MAVDGVAPRAKMNQQRARRFRAAYDSKAKRERNTEYIAALTKEGKSVLPSRDGGFDSNCITPGTEFMQRISASLRHYITDRLSNSPSWKDLLVRYRVLCVVLSVCTAAESIFACN